MISMDKTYTSFGKPVRILCTDANGAYPVVALHDSGIAMNYCADGTQPTSAMYNLVEVSPFADFKVDEPVMVRDNNSEQWYRKLFVGVSKLTGFVEASDYCAWIRQGSTPLSVWYQCRRPTPEELAS